MKLSDAIIAALIAGACTVFAAVYNHQPPSSTSTPRAETLQMEKARAAFSGNWLETDRKFRWHLEVKNDGSITGYTRDTGGVEHTLEGKVDSEKAFQGRVFRKRPGVTTDRAVGSVSAHVTDLGFSWDLKWLEHSVPDGEIDLNKQEHSNFVKEQE